MNKAPDHKPGKILRISFYKNKDLTFNFYFCFLVSKFAFLYISVKLDLRAKKRV